MAKAITVTSGRISFKNFTVEDPVIGEYFSSLKEDEEELKTGVHRALRIGVLALSDERLSTLIGRIDKDLSARTRRSGSRGISIRRALDGSDDEAVALAGYVSGAESHYQWTFERRRHRGSGPAIGRLDNGSPRR